MVISKVFADTGKSGITSTYRKEVQSETLCSLCICLSLLYVDKVDVDAASVIWSMVLESGTVREGEDHICATIINGKVLVVARVDLALVHIGGICKVTRGSADDPENIDKIPVAVTS
jgi:hypothetical protein